MQIFLLERGDKPEKGGGGWCRNGVLPFFVLFTVQFNPIYCVCVCVFVVGGGSKVPFITFWIFSLLSLSCKILIQVFIKIFILVLIQVLY